MRHLAIGIVAAFVAGCGGSEPPPAAPKTDPLTKFTPAPQARAGSGAPAGGVAFPVETGKSEISDTIIENYMRAADEFLRAAPDFAALFQTPTPSSAAPQPGSGVDPLNAIAARHGFGNYQNFTVVHSKVWGTYLVQTIIDGAAASEADFARQKAQIEKELTSPEFTAEEKEGMKQSLEILANSRAAAAATIATLPAEESAVIKRNSARLKQWAAAIRADRARN